MQSLRDAIQNAVDRKQMPAFQPGKIRNLAVNLGLSVPISVLNLINTLNNLPPAVVIYNSGQLTTSYVHGWAQVLLQSDGLWSFHGHVHESGAVGDNYLFMMAFVDVKDASGKMLIFLRNENVKGQLDIGSSDDDWQINGFNQLAADQWNIIKNTRVQPLFHSSTDPFQAVETVLLSAPIVAAAFIVGALFLSKNDNDPDVQCPPDIYGDNRDPNEGEPYRPHNQRTCNKGKPIN